MEDTFRQRYKSNYKRIQMTTGILGGEEASVWVFELKRSDGPLLRKLYLGRSHTWDSYVVACTAPARDFDKWQPVFEQLIRGFEFR